VDGDLSRRRLSKAAHELEEGRLPAPGGTYEANHLARLDAKLEALDHLQLAERMGEAADVDRAAFEIWMLRRAGEASAPVRRLGGPLN
jgi:hypothetical protein